MQAEDTRSTGPRVHLLGGPYVVVDGLRHCIPEGSKRLLAFVALRQGRVERRHVAGTLWPEGGDDRAAGNLRSALWRLRRAGVDVIRCEKWTLSLMDGVAVDVQEIRSWADRMIGGVPRADDLAKGPPDADALDLLPGWYDDWAILERERLRQRVLHGLEAMSKELSLRGLHADAVESALVAVNAEPLRESGQRALIAAYLDEGNWIEAQRALQGFRGLLAGELGVIPSAELTRLVEDERTARTALSRGDISPQLGIHFAGP